MENTVNEHLSSSQNYKICPMFTKHNLWALQISKYRICNDSVASYVIKKCRGRFLVPQATCNRPQKFINDNKQISTY